MAFSPDGTQFRKLWTGDLQGCVLYSSQQPVRTATNTTQQHELGVDENNDEERVSKLPLFLWS